MASVVDAFTHVRVRQDAPLWHQLDRLARLVIAVDAAAIGLSVFVAWQLRVALEGMLVPVVVETTVANALVPVVFALWLGTLAVRGAYRRHMFGAGHDEFRSVAAGTLIAFALIATLAFLVHSNTSRVFLLLCFAVGMPLLLAERYALRKALHALRRRGHLRSRVVAVCAPSALSELLPTLARAEHLGMSIVGTCVPEAHRSRDLDLPVPCFGGVDDIVAACEETGADTVLVAGGGYPTSMALRKIGWALEGRDVELVVVPSLIDVAGPRIQMRHVSGLPLVHVEQPQVGAAGGFAKRAFDVVVASLMLLLASPVMVAVAAAVKLTDRGPVFYRQERSGRNGGRFQITKFRSMVVDADARLPELVDFNDVDYVLFKMKNDPRITRVGRFIRRYSLDELPQLFDVLRGDMSLVGPRPPLPREVEQYPADMHRRLLVRPGLTGLWQVSGRSNLSFDEAIRMDLYYVDNWSIVGDLIIMLKTVRAVWRSEGAY